MGKVQKAFHLKNGTVRHGVFWPTIKVNAHVLIVTGMEEHALRYTDFAAMLNANNFDVYSIDYFGQGESIVMGGEVKGRVPFDSFEKFVDVLGEIAGGLIQDKKPLYIFGHSMGSFLTQRFIQKYPKIAAKVVICGSNGPSVLFGLGNMVASLIVNKKNWNEHGKLLPSLSVGAYAKSIKGAETAVDWLSYNKENVANYIESPLDGGPSSNGFYRELLKGTSRLYHKKKYSAVDRNLPLLIISGEDDPVGANGKGVRKLIKMYENLGFTNVSYKLYVKMRHEILNETNKEQVYNDVLKFLKDN